MNSKYLIFVLLLIVSCKESKKTEPLLVQQKKNTNSKENLNTPKEEKLKKDSKIVEIGYQEKLESLPHFELDSIDETEYKRIPLSTSFKKTIIESNNDFFYIQGANKKYEFKKYRDYKGEESWSGFEYLGCCTSLNLVAIRESSTAEHLGFSENELLDTSNDFQYKIISLGDGSGSVPELSPDGKFMVYFQNPEYESGTLSIVILKINDKIDPTRFLTEYKSSFSKSGDSIEEIKWASNRVFYIKTFKSVGFNENGQELRDYFYYKGEI
ncbi:hypothetical protein [Flavobacterium sp. JAS]|uniref:hypothetical protein n=1 Tax=Flavobacterium sp. JAS TaxID=2897329 RepID=UPI001E576B88|nr:hypothetical protein [Flavobacterium sp. JAS]MCD0472298.1 hypothetical protein [Flavobacterium sp. JAS]